MFKFEKIENKYVRGFLGLLVAATVGGLGGGIWERILEPSFSFCLEGIVKFFAFFSNYYLDSLYREIGNANKEGFSFSVYFFFITVLMTAGFVWVLNFFDRIKTKMKEVKKLLAPPAEKSEPKTTEELETRLNKLHSHFRKARIVALSLMFLAALVILSGLARDVYQYRTVLYIEKTIEIVAPYIDTHTLLLIKSEYRQIDSKEKFALLNMKLNAIAKQNKIKLTEFNYIE